MYESSNHLYSLFCEWNGENKFEYSAYLVDYLQYYPEYTNHILLVWDVNGYQAMSWLTDDETEYKKNEIYDRVRSNLFGWLEVSKWCVSLLRLINVVCCCVFSQELQLLSPPILWWAVAFETLHDSKNSWWRKYNWKLVDDHENRINYAALNHAYVIT